MKTVIEMAREAGKTKWFGTHPDGTNDFLGVEFTPKQLERFVALVREDERNRAPQTCEKHCERNAYQNEIRRLKDEREKLEPYLRSPRTGEMNISMREEVKAAVLAEREACAKVCESIYTNGDGVEGWLERAAEYIRGRSNHGKN